MIDRPLAALPLPEWQHRAQITQSWTSTMGKEWGNISLHEARQLTHLPIHWDTSLLHYQYYWFNLPKMDNNGSLHRGPLIIRQIVLPFGGDKVSAGFRATHRRTHTWFNLFPIKLFSGVWLGIPCTAAERHQRHAFVPIGAVTWECFKVTNSWRRDKWAAPEKPASQSVDNLWADYATGSLGWRASHLSIGAAFVYPMDGCWSWAGIIIMQKALIQWNQWGWVVELGWTSDPSKQ